MIQGMILVMAKIKLIESLRSIAIYPAVYRLRRIILMNIAMLA